jgi:tRNA A37 threonylcarbamoyladenosine dehydratase
MDLLECKHGIRIGGKKNPGRRQTADLADSSNDPLADSRAVKRQHDV